MSPGLVGAFSSAVVPTAQTSSEARAVTEANDSGNAPACGRCTCVHDKPSQWIATGFVIPRAGSLPGSRIVPTAQTSCLEVAAIEDREGERSGLNGRGARCQRVPFQRSTSPRSPAPPTAQARSGPVSTMPRRSAPWVNRGPRVRRHREPFQWTIIGPPGAELRPAPHASSVETASTLARPCAPDGSDGTASADQVAPSHSHERERHVVAVIPTPTIHAFVVEEASTAKGVNALENSGVVASVHPHGAPAFAAGAQAREPATTRSPIKARRMSLMSGR